MRTAEELLAEYKARLAERVPTTPRFSDGWTTPAELTAEALRLAYRNRIECKGKKYVETPRLAAVIAGLGRWVTGGKKNCLFFSGNFGNGKTTLALSLMDMLACWGGIRTRSIAAVDYARAIAREDDTTAERAKEKGVLLIDDIGTEAVSVKSYGTEYNPVIELLYYRYDHSLPTICTSNLTLEQFNDTYGPRVADRAREMFDWVTFTDKSFR